MYEQVLGSYKVQGEVKKKKDKYIKKSLNQQMSPPTKQPLNQPIH